MTADEKYKLSAYKEISLLSDDVSKKIYIVKDESTDRLFIKKVLPCSENISFYRRLASLEHKNLAKIYDVFQDDDRLYIIEEYISGQSLRALLDNSGVQPEGKIIDYASQLCRALIYLHNQTPPIIHRDIKPENIMLSIDDVIKLVDFDIAREHKEKANRDTVFMGTRDYAAPEQYGYKQSDCRTDIYALGVLIHEMATGKLLENNIAYKGTLKKIIDRCVKIDPDNRFQSVADLDKALRQKRPLHRKGLVGLAVISIMCLGCLFAYIKIFILGIGGEYEGELINGMQNGYGIYTWVNGSKYEGEWKNDEMDGFGTYFWTDGSVYVGDWVGGKKEGNGIETWPDGTKYEGEWKSDVPDGFGTYMYANGESYSGDWKSGKMEGNGTYTWPDGSSWVGTWKNDFPDGEGIYTDANGVMWHEVYEKGKKISSTKYIQ